MRRLAILLLAIGLAAGTLSAQPRYGIPTPPQPYAQPQYAQPQYAQPYAQPQPYGQPQYAQPYAQPQAYAPQAPQTSAAELDQRIAAADAREREAHDAQVRLQTEIDELDTRREATRVELHRRARALYRVRRAGMLPIAGGFDALLGHLSRVERVERMVRSDLGALTFLRDRQRALEAEIANQREVVASAQAEKLTLEREKQRVEQLTQAQQLYAGIFDPSYAPRLPVTTPQPAPAWTRQQPAYGQITVHGQDTQASGFVAQRGSLALPVSGGAVREAQREDGQGLEFVSPGSSVVAAADGRVAFAQRYNGYGQLVILDHGNDYFTLYGGLSQTALTRGEWVGRGARIGSISSAPLFFAVRQGTRSLNARSWVGL